MIHAPARRDDAPLIRQFIQDKAWGHHACGTRAIRPAHRAGVDNTTGEVHGVSRLRVVDASVVPRSPGHFIASAVLMIGEKAADVIAADAGTPAAAATAPSRA